VPVPAPQAPVGSPYDTSGVAPAADFLPAIGGQPANAHLNFAAGANPAQPAQPAQHPAHPADGQQQAQPGAAQGPGGPQQPRPQPGIVPDLPGHNAA
jgi:hypothetical protein